MRLDSRLEKLEREHQGEDAQALVFTTIYEDLNGEPESETYYVSICWGDYKAVCVSRKPTSSSGQRLRLAPIGPSGSMKSKTSFRSRFCFVSSRS